MYLDDINAGFKDQNSIAQPTTKDNPIYVLMLTSVYLFGLAKFAL